MAKITSIKAESRNGRAAHHFAGTLSDKFGVVFSGGDLILNMRDGERVWHLSLDDVETALLAKRFDERAAVFSKSDAPDIAYPPDDGSLKALSDRNAIHREALMAAARQLQAALHVPGFGVQALAENCVCAYLAARERLSRAARTEG